METGKTQDWILELDSTMEKAKEIHNNLNGGKWTCLEVISMK
jgi:hypothetical protein